MTHFDRIYWNKMYNCRLLYQLAFFDVKKHVVAFIYCNGLYLLSVLLLGQHDLAERAFSKDLEETEVLKGAFGRAAALTIDQLLQRRFS